MPKYLIEANYIGEGVGGLLKEGGTVRRYAVDELFASLGGTVESFYYAFGDTDLFIIGELPDHAAATALALKVNASGLARCRTTVLMAPSEVDDAARKVISVNYRPPGHGGTEYEISTWDNEGGHLRPGAPGDEVMD